MLLKKYPDNTIGLIGHSIINYPSPELAMAAVGLMAEVGVDLIELQIPFSEPIADGPVFMAANHAALAAGVTVKDCFNFMQQASAKWQVPLVFMTYANIIYKQGFAEFVAHAKAVGAKGAIVPDLPIDMAAEYLAACEQQDFAPVQVIPPNVSDARLKLLTKASKGFVYAVARTGVTGAKTEFGTQLIGLLKRLRDVTDLPIAVGFGVSGPEDIEFLKPYADYAIVGSQGLRVLQQSGLDGLRQFWVGLKKAAGSSILSKSEF